MTGKSLTSLVITDPSEIELVIRWRRYQQWIKSLPTGLDLRPAVTNVRKPKTGSGKRYDPKL
jgi:hypothetical protein